MPVRRQADSINVQYIWDSIKSAIYHHQKPDASYIIKFLQTGRHCTSEQADLYLSQALQDNLVVKYESNNQNGQPIDCYRFPMEKSLPHKDGKDWYCIECHLAGDVLLCKQCHLVFHAECSRDVRYKQTAFQSIEKHYQAKGDDNDTTLGFSNDESCEITLSSILKTSGDTELSSTSNLANNTVILENKHQNSKGAFIYNESICSICNLHNLEGLCEIPREELNHLLGFILHRIRSWLPSNLTHTMAPDQIYEWTDEEDLNWRATQLFYQHVDMSVLELKLHANEYTNLIEFLADVVTIQHNVAIFHGTESQEYGAAELMIRDTCYDISEIKTCIDCYRHSNEKMNNKWFCFPCRKPHKLVWAKQKGFPFWPAKIIKETDIMCDVRFFGGKYERSFLQKNKKNILPIETKPKNNEIKKSAAFNKAMEELKLHQQFLANPSLVDKLISEAATPEKFKTVRKSVNVKSNKRTENISAYTNMVQDFDNKKLLLDSKQNIKIPLKKPIKRKSTPGQTTTAKISKHYPKFESKLAQSSIQDVIPISDAEEDEVVTYSNCSTGRSSKGCYGQVSSSTEYLSSNDGEYQVSDVMHPLEQPYSDAVEKMRRKLEQAKDKKDLINIAMDCMQQEIDKITNDHNEHIKKLMEAHQIQISDTKKKQWCYNCEQDAIYHCCWNTAYCSPTCQQQHWQAEHKKVCRRKRL